MILVSFLCIFISRRIFKHNHCRISRDVANFSKDWIQWNYRTRAEVTRVATFAQTFLQALQTSHVRWHKRDADFSVISTRHRLFDIVWDARSKNILPFLSLFSFSLSILAANNSSKTKQEKMLSSLDDTWIFGKPPTRDPGNRRDESVKGWACSHNVACYAQTTKIWD